MLCHLGGSVGFKFCFLVVQIPRYWQLVYIDSKSLDYSIPLFIILHSDPKFFSAVFPLEWDGSMETMQYGIILEYTTWPWYIQHRFHSCLTAPWAFAKSKIRLLLAFFPHFCWCGISLAYVGPVLGLCLDQGLYWKLNHSFLPPWGWSTLSPQTIF